MFVRGRPKLSREWQRCAAVVILALAVFARDIAPAAAQDINPFAWFEQLFKPKPPPAVTNPSGDIHIAPAKKPPRKPKPVARPVEKPAVAPTFFVAILGDSLGQMLGQGLGEALADRPDVAISRLAKASSGLVRDDYHDWVQAAKDIAKDIASGKERIDFAVMMIGSNDRQSLRTAEGSYEPRSEKWLEAYAARIEVIAGVFRDHKVPLVWVGLPVLKSDTLAKDALAFNELYRTHAAKAGAIYVDVWEAFADEAGSYSATGPDIDGQIVKLRAADGVHFTKAGARKLAHFVEPEIRRRLGDFTPPTQPVAPDLVPNAAVPGSPEAQEPEKPVAGPVLSLTSPPLAPGAVLATPLDNAREAQTRAGKTIERVFSEGRALDPKPGRVDDFAWPRQ
jgi:hypothetical protein